MRVYDLALMFIRASVVMAFLRESFDMVLDIVRYILMPLSVGMETRVLFVLTPAVALIATSVILAASKPMARFAAKLSATTDVAGHF